MKNYYFGFIRDLRITNICTIFCMDKEIHLTEMKKHNGMRPLDIVVLMKIAANENQEFRIMDLAKELFISNSEISESLNRSVIAGLIDSAKKKVFKRAFLEFIKSGLKYVFPQRPGPIVKGIATAHSAPSIKGKFISNEKYVWPDPHGKDRGQAIEPLYKSVPEAVKRDPKLYEYLAMCEMIRVGKAREVEFANKFFNDKF